MLSQTGPPSVGSEADGSQFPNGVLWFLLTRSKGGAAPPPAPFCSRTGIFSPRSIVPSAAWVLCTPRRFGAWGIKRQSPRLASLVGGAVWTVR